MRSRPEVVKFAGALQGKKVRKAILIAGTQLAELMIDHGVGVTTEAYHLKRIELDYFSEE